MNETIFNNARVVTPNGVVDGSVQVQGGKIAGIGGASQLNGAVDLDGHYLLPGCVEVHTDNLEKHLQPRGTKWPALPALLAHDAQVAGLGITTVLNAVCIGVEADLHGLPRDFFDDCAPALRQAKQANLLRSEHFLHVRCELPHPETAARMEAILENEDLILASLMDHTPGQRQVTDIARLRKGYERMGPVNDDWFAERMAYEQDKQARYAEPNRRRLAEMLRGKGIAVASHDDANAEHVAEALRDGVTISEFPTTLEAAQAARAAGLKNVMGAPNVVLGGSQSGNLSAMEAARAGLVDGLSSDYAPVSLVQAAFLLSQLLELPLERCVAWISRGPAEMAGLLDRGAIAPGLRADLLEVALVGDLPCVVRVWREGVRVA